MPLLQTLERETNAYDGAVMSDTLLTSIVDV
jgi:hypothetical protein